MGASPAGRAAMEAVFMGSPSRERRRGKETVCSIVRRKTSAFHLASEESQHQPGSRRHTANRSTPTVARSVLVIAVTGARPLTPVNISIIPGVVVMPLTYLPDPSNRRRPKHPGKAPQQQAGEFSRPDSSRAHYSGGGRRHPSYGLKPGRPALTKWREVPGAGPLSPVGASGGQLSSPDPAKPKYPIADADVLHRVRPTATAGKVWAPIVRSRRDRGFRPGSTTRG